MMSRHLLVQFRNILTRRLTCGINLEIALDQSVNISLKCKHFESFVQCINDKHCECIFDVPKELITSFISPVRVLKYWTCLELFVCINFTLVQPMLQYL